MIRKVILLGIFALSILTAKSQSLPDKTMWEGQLGPLRLVLRVFPDSIKHVQKAVFDSPDQGAKNLTVSQLRITNDSLIARSAMIGGVFSGKFNTDKTEINGFWKQGTIDAPLVLKRITSLAGPNRPQTPKPPFPYISEDVEYNNADKSVHFGATLTLPKPAGKFPAVILISGSGQQDRDETIFDHKLFAVISDHLTRNGIAVLRVDDRGVGKTTGEVQHATSADFAKDVLSSIAYLKSRKEIDPKQIGLIGHSEGGLIAPLVINQSSDVAFFVSLAGVGQKGLTLIKRQNADLLRAAVLDDEQLNALTSLYARMFDFAYSVSIDAPLNLEPVFNKWRSEQPKALVDSLKVGLGQPGEQAVKNLAKTINLKWMHFFIKYDPELVLSKIKIPVLALNGSKDIQVSAKDNLAGFKRLLTKAGNKDFETLELPGLNHLFQTANTGYVTEYASIEETISPAALEIMSAWINKHVKK